MKTLTSPEHRVETAPAAQPTRKFRPEIQGLRALAVLLVAAYHFWFGRVSGGVDVFLLISAFLMAGSFARKIEKGTFAGIRTVLTYWVHVFKRILPLATLTVVATLAGAYFWLPAERWLSLLSEARSVMLYRENWWSIKNTVDYYAADTSSASPFRHFWSLSLQGQIYLLWPLLFLLAWALVKTFRFKALPTLLVIFGAVFAYSLNFSIKLTASDQQIAYFHTEARLWEFALGTLVALALPLFRLKNITRAIMGWAGIAMIISCGFIFDVEGAFPGYAALWPTLAASFIIIAGDTQTKFGPEKLLTIKPLLKLGGFSYALYLVHWPLLVFYLYRVDQEKAGFGAGLVLLAISIVIAWAITKFIETPLRTWKWSEAKPIRALGVVAVCVLLGLIPIASWNKAIATTTLQAQANRGLNNEGAKTLEAGFVYEGEENPTVIPVRTSGKDWADRGPLCVETNPDWDLDEAQARDCHHTVVNDQPSKTVVAVGNSHMQMWAPVLRQLAEDQGWDLTMMTTGGCFYGTEDIKDDELFEDCLESSASMHDLISDLDPDLVFMTATRSAPDEDDELLAGAENRVDQLLADGRTVVGIRDTPRLATMHKDCLDRGGSEETCAMDPGQDVYSDPQLEIEVEKPGFGAVNMSDVVCPENSCPVTIGNIYVYQDYDHINATYAETTYDFFAQRALDAISRAETNSGKSAQTS